MLAQASLKKHQTIILNRFLTVLDRGGIFSGFADSTFSQSLNGKEKGERGYLPKATVPSDWHCSPRSLFNINPCESLLSNAVTWRESRVSVCDFREDTIQCIAEVFLSC